MSSSDPPRLASALMRWMGPRDEALIGDLVEAYQSSRSDWWYWRQVLAAIVIGAGSSVRSHKMLALHAIVLGWGVWLLYTHYLGSSVFAAANTIFNFTEFPFVTGLLDWFYVHNIDFPETLARSGPSIVTAWIGMFASGWLVGWVHRSHGAGMVLAYCVTLPLPLAGAILWGIVVHGDFSGPAIPLLVSTTFVLIYLPALVGGLWAVRPRNRTPSLVRD